MAQDWAVNPSRQPCDDRARVCLTTWLTQRATDDLLPSELITRAEDILRPWQILLPALSTLEELVTSATARVHDEVYTRIAAGLSPELHKTILDHIVTLHDQLLSKHMRKAKNTFEKRDHRLHRPYRRGLATLIMRTFSSKASRWAWSIASCWLGCAPWMPCVCCAMTSTQRRW